jgi:hypothetical protein
MEDCAATVSLIRTEVLPVYVTDHDVNMVITSYGVVGSPHLTGNGSVLQPCRTTLCRSLLPKPYRSAPRALRDYSFVCK